MIKSFRGQLASGGQETIRLSTNNGLTGYKIVKFEIIPTTPGAANYEGIGKIWNVKQTTVNGAVDFSNSELLGVAYLIDNSSSAVVSSKIIIYDNVTFNQDIFITGFDGGSAAATNYYLELEQVRLDLNEATVATLKDMRGSN